ncbi:NAD dependent epimerase/dehydratase [Aspergillus bombycis]|uniref:NAD dependent epimerase/dehydratase n=1 Tax=Aspergillus bombycis TaxID=109264 RepID=A0A1F7ZMB1_9EURO|nr:NAD dependent epimerase/dehydratase [Aspergillus bombycis]OGM40584.1 NAD dependent epimerase/dehydratase [Aspergillus bombycis]
MGQQASTPQQGTKIQVIGAGLSRTGTASFSSALNILLEGPVYHGGTQVTMGPPKEIKSWIKIMRNCMTGVPQDREKALTLLEETLDGYAAITDVPGSQLVPELLELYPDAMVICTVRDPEAWFKSYMQVRDLATLWFLPAVLLPLPGMRHFVEWISLFPKQRRRLYGEPESMADIYHRHIAWLKEVVPQDRLVFFDVREGWEPLCKVLGKDVPKDIAFPRINDGKAMDAVARSHIKRGLTRWAAFLSVVGVITAWSVLR